MCLRDGESEWYWRIQCTPQSLKDKLPYLDIFTNVAISNYRKSYLPVNKKSGYVVFLICIRLLLGRKVMTNLDSIFKSRDITLPTKVLLVKAMVFPVVMYGCESWTVKKAEC